MDNDAKIRQRFGKRVRFYRRQREWLLEDLAQRIGKSVTTLSRIETGRQNVTIVEIVALARALGVNVSDLFLDKSGKQMFLQGGMLSAGALMARCMELVEKAADLQSDVKGLQEDIGQAVCDPSKSPLLEYFNELQYA